VSCTSDEMLPAGPDAPIGLFVLAALRPGFNWVALLVYGSGFADSGRLNQRYDFCLSLTYKR